MRGPDGGMCGAATVVHAVDALRGRMTALCYMRSMKKTLSVVSTLVGVTELVWQMRSQVLVQPYTRIDLQHLKKADRQLFDERPYEWLSR